MKACVRVRKSGRGLEWGRKKHGIRIGEKTKKELYALDGPKRSQGDGIRRQRGSTSKLSLSRVNQRAGGLR